MSKRRQKLLELRREVLVARSAMLRLRAAGEIEALRESVTLPGLVGSVASSGPARSMLFGTLLVVLGGTRLSRMLRLAAGIVAGARLVRFLVRQARARGQGAGDGPRAA
ncbi:MAG TPA: hypothetical protein VN782_07925 [Usitatibacter sp.]|nr:hypothetical protein [Usitatibacter sp.]